MALGTGHGSRPIGLPALTGLRSTRAELCAAGAHVGLQLADVADDQAESAGRLESLVQLALLTGAPGAPALDLDERHAPGWRQARHDVGHAHVVPVGAQLEPAAGPRRHARAGVDGRGGAAREAQI